MVTLSASECFLLANCETVVPRMDFGQREEE